MIQMDFVKLNGVTVRTTSFAKDEATGVMTLVVIARGSTDADKLAEVLKTSPLTLEQTGEEPLEVEIANQEQMTSGEGERVITRFSITLVPVGSGPVSAPKRASGGDDHNSALEEIEGKLRELAESVRSLRSRLRE